MRSDQVRLTYERLAVVREVAGPDAEIALDGHFSFDVETAIRLAQGARAARPQMVRGSGPDPQLRRAEARPRREPDPDLRRRDARRRPVPRDDRPPRGRHRPPGPAVRRRPPRGQEGGRLRGPQRDPAGDPQQRIGDEHHRRGAPRRGCPNFIGLEYHFWDAKWIGQVVRREGVPLFDETGHVPLTDAPGFGVEIDTASPSGISRRASRCSEPGSRATGSARRSLDERRNATVDCRQYAQREGSPTTWPTSRSASRGSLASSAP